jgi:hypothetical protein
MSILTIYVSDMDFPLDLNDVQNEVEVVTSSTPAAANVAELYPRTILCSLPYRQDGFFVIGC